MSKQLWLTVGGLLSMLESGEADLIRFARPFHRDPRWIARLWGSLARDPAWPIGIITCWQAPDAEATGGGRYRDVSAGGRVVLDGLQRCWALAAGAGVRPGCVPSDVWADLGGGSLECAAVMDRAGTVSIVPHRAGDPSQVPLSALLRSGGAGALAELRDRLLGTPVPVATVGGDLAEAAACHEALDRGAARRALSDAEVETRLLDIAVPGLRRDVLDRIMSSADRVGFGEVVTVPVVNELIQQQLPPAARRRGVGRCYPGLVGQAADRAEHGCRAMIGALGRQGLISPDLVGDRQAVTVLLHLAVRFPEAPSSSFTRRWLVHALAADRYRASRRLADSDIALLHQQNCYGDACRALAAVLPAGPPRPLELARLTGRRRGRFSSEAALYAMAAACPSGLGVIDLADPDAIFPEDGMGLAPLWPTNPAASLGGWILATPATAEVLRRHGGWTRTTYEELRCGSHALDSHHLPPPAHRTTGPAPPDLATRDLDLLHMINAFLARTGPLTDTDVSGDTR